MSRFSFVLVAALVAGAVLWFAASSARPRDPRAHEPAARAEAVEERASVPLEPPHAVATDATVEAAPPSERKAIHVVETEKAPAVAPSPRRDVASLAGRVVDDRGRGVPDFCIEGKRIDASGERSDDDEMREFFRDTDGSFAIEGVALGRWELRATDQRAHASSELVSVSLPVRDQIEIVIPREAVVSGRVLDPSGAPMLGASVQSTRQELLPGIWGTGYPTDDHGLFEIRPYPGRIALLASGSGFAPSEILRLETKPGETVAGIVLRLRNGATISGELIGSDGRPQSARRVSLLSWESSDHCETDANGRFQFAGIPPGEINLWAKTREGVDLHETLSVSEGESVGTRLAAPGSFVRVHGRVTAGGEPFAGGQVQAYRAIEEGASSSGFGHGKTDNDGAYELAVAEAGRYHLKIDGHEPYLAWEEVIDVPTVEEFELDVSIRLGRISGRVTDSAGRGVQETAVYASSEQLGEEGIGFAAAQTDSEGRYELIVPTGAYRVTAGGGRQELREGGPIYAGARVSGLFVAEDEHLQGVDLVLEAGGILEGIVRNADGSPAARTMLWFEAEARLEMLGASEMDGRFRFAVAAGKHLVSGYGGTGAVREPVRIEIVAGEARSIELTLGGK